MLRSFDGLTTRQQLERLLCNRLVVETVAVGEVNGSNNSIVLTARVGIATVAIESVTAVVIDLHV